MTETMETGTTGITGGGTRAATAMTLRRLARQAAALGLAAALFGPFEYGDDEATVSATMNDGAKALFALQEETEVDRHQQLARW